MKVYQPYPGKGFTYGVIFLISLIVLFSGLGYMMYQTTHNFWSLISMGSIVLILGAVFSCFMYIAKTLKYIIRDKQLVIQYGFNKKVMDLDKIGDLKVQKGFTAFKTIGAGWPGLHMGYYVMAKVGSINLFATRLIGDMVVFKYQWETIGITPENPQEFINDLKAINPDIDTKKINPQEMLEAKAEAEARNKKLYQNLILGNLFLIFLTFLWISLKVPSLPDQIPMHFGPNGVDRYGSPLELYIFPLISTLVFGISILTVRNKRSSASALYSVFGFSMIMTLVMNMAIISILSL